MTLHALSAAFAESSDAFFLSALAGALSGVIVGGTVTAWASYVLARRMFRSKVLDHARKELKAPLGAYMDWLTTVSGEFAIWKTDLLPSYIADSNQDTFQLNRMRKLFVDPRNSQWLARLEEYDAILPKFTAAIKSMWMRQSEIAEQFNRVFASLETDPPDAVNAGERIETLAFEQGQLVSDFLYQLQYECLRSVASRKPKSPKDMVKPRIIRTSWGNVKMVSPKAF